jgi:hypothetical protein
VSIIIHSKYKSKEEAILQLVANFFNEGEMIVEGTRNTIKSNFLADEKVNIKFFQKPGILKTVIYSFFRSTKAKRSFDYANYLLKNAISTPFPIAYIENRNRFGLLMDSYYICQQIEYDFTIRELIHDPLFPERNVILEQFAGFTFKLHEAKVNFLDHSPGNTLVVKKGFNDYDFFLIDLNRMRFEDLTIEDRMDNFKKMWLSKKMVNVVAEAYAKLYNQPADKLRAILLDKTRSFKRKITKKKYFKKKFHITID